ncbi:MAG: Trm112 family protein [Ardenticatenales bacterium]|nr:Trm112 family protein [Ardenticatenales bacterium]
MNAELLARLVCPLDKGPLELVDGKWLVNRRNGYRYPITDGIPVMLIEVGERYKDAALVTADAAR